MVKKATLMKSLTMRYACFSLSNCFVAQTRPKLFRRIVANEKRRRAHAFALSYELEVGSSYDPSFDDEILDADQQQEEEQPPEDYLFDENDIDPEDYNFSQQDVSEEEDPGDAWLDAYIASLPDDALEAMASSQTTTSESRSGSRTPTLNPVADQALQQTQCASFSGEDNTTQSDDIMMG